MIVLFLSLLNNIYHPFSLEQYCNSDRGKVDPCPIPQDQGSQWHDDDGVVTKAIVKEDELFFTKINSEYYLREIQTQWDRQRIRSLKLPLVNRECLVLETLFKESNEPMSVYKFTPPLFSPST
ncbi:hypothetical protein VNO77_05574 [Canavalia gladiata]|uniref:Uncharacterized protein n=1 Tax=Canavalia gladiata TaxID=3824 RepID=A0AAN9N0P3_CANGL